MPKHRFSAADTALPAMTRRAALAAPLVLLPRNVFASSESPILSLFREHERLRIRHNAEEGSEAEDRIFEEMQAVERRMMALPSLAAADFAAKVICDTCRGGLFSDWETGALWIEARSLTGCGL